MRIGVAGVADPGPEGLKVERLAPKPLDRIACAAAPSQRVEGNTLYPRTGLSEAGYTKHPISCVPNGRRLPAIRPPKIISIFPIPRSL